MDHRDRGKLGPGSQSRERSHSAPDFPCCRNTHCTEDQSEDPSEAEQVDRDTGLRGSAY